MERKAGGPVGKCRKLLHSPLLNPNVLNINLFITGSLKSNSYCLRNCSSEFWFDFQELEMFSWILLKWQLDKPFIWSLILSSQYSPNQKAFTTPAFEKLAADGGQLAETLRQGTASKFSTRPHSSERIMSVQGADIALTARRFSTQG